MSVAATRCPRLTRHHHRGEAGTAWGGRTAMTSRIRAARMDRNWSQTRLIAELERVGLRHGVNLPGRETLKSRVSRWENGHAKPDEFYRQLLREALGMDDRELGLDTTGTEPVTVAAEEL